MQFLWCTLFTKATPTKYIDLPWFQLPYKQKQKPKPCLTNHKGSISHPITSLVINSLGGGHTHTYMHTDIVDKSNFKKPVMHWPLAGVQLWLKLFAFLQISLTLKIDLCTALLSIWFNSYETNLLIWVWVLWLDKYPWLVVMWLEKYLPSWKLPHDWPESLAIELATTCGI